MAILNLRCGLCSRVAAVRGRNPVVLPVAVGNLAGCAGGPAGGDCIPVSVSRVMDYRRISSAVTFLTAGLSQVRPPPANVSVFEDIASPEGPDDLVPALLTDWCIVDILCPNDCCKSSGGMGSITGILE